MRENRWFQSMLSKCSLTNGKYLQAGVLVNGVFEKTDKGTSQGGNISRICKHKKIILENIK